MDQIAIRITLVPDIIAMVFTIFIHALALSAVIGFVRRKRRPTVFAQARPPSSGFNCENCTAFRIGVAIVTMAAASGPTIRYAAQILRRNA